MQTHTLPEVLIIRLRSVPFIDMTGIQTLAQVIEQLHKRNVRVVLCEANQRVRTKLEKAGVLRADALAVYTQQFVDAVRQNTPPITNTH